MHGSECDLRMLGDDLFRAISMMRIEIPDRDAGNAVVERVQSSQGDVAEVTESHRAVSHCVVTRRPHQTERRCATHRSLCCRDRSARRTRRMIKNLRVSGCVGVKIRGGLFNSLDVLDRVASLQRLVCSWIWLVPLPLRMTLAQKRHRLREARRTFRVSGKGILRGARVVKYDHWSIVADTKQRNYKCAKLFCRPKRFDRRLEEPPT